MTRPDEYHSAQIYDDAVEALMAEEGLTEREAKERVGVLFQCAKTTK